ncbi:uncharacterized protein OCT59_001575 [Rhizophagus irregularis]|uniref:uncharacterized protein n=1 Tax=Rhizophagus irregularis TaxID=588596 RepID=UPI0019F8B6A7|nr:hypothetical protein OCT59_001575 [Rhizophagus irregularis]GBC50424.2 hypothetical protein RIR_jg11467.t1 [Rhizophagus irregularis DAOM 181602=DAOM 197198]
MQLAHQTARYLLKTICEVMSSKIQKFMPLNQPIESVNLFIKNNIILSSYKLPRKPTFVFVNYLLVSRQVGLKIWYDF